MICASGPKCNVRSGSCTLRRKIVHMLLSGYERHARPPTGHHLHRPTPLSPKSPVTEFGPGAVGVIEVGVHPSHREPSQLSPPASCVHPPVNRRANWIFHRHVGIHSCIVLHCDFALASDAHHSSKVGHNRPAMMIAEISKKIRKPGRPQGTGKSVRGCAYNRFLGPGRSPPGSMLSASGLLDGS